MSIHFSIPASGWKTLEEFALWYKNNSYPVRPPACEKIYVTDNSYSCIVFRHGVYQAELYMIAPNKKGRPHSHGFENLPIFMGGSMYGTMESYPQGSYIGVEEIQGGDCNLPHSNSGGIGTILPQGQWHNIDTFEKGCLIYVLQKWAHEEEMTSAAANYIGEPMGPIHSSIILPKT